MLLVKLQKTELQDRQLKARIRIDGGTDGILKAKRSNEKFKDFADIYHELYVEVGCEIFQNFLNKGKKHQNRFLKS